MTGWPARLRALAERGPVAMISVLATEGSAPRGAGTRMFVADAVDGTIGGGELEHRAVAQARAMLALPPGSWRIQDYPLGPLLGQCCGGRVRVLIEHVDPAALAWTAAAGDAAMLVSTLAADTVERRIDTAKKPVPSARLSARGERPAPGATWREAVAGYRRPLYLFGAGHVGHAVARHAERLPFRLAWFDVRPELTAIDAVTVVAADAVEACLADAPPDAAVVIMTHDHALDFLLTRAALVGPPLAYVGLIGSATKKARFLARLTSDGVDAARQQRLIAPIGIAGVTGKEPDDIAVATLAQLLQLPRPAAP